MMLTKPVLGVIPLLLLVNSLFAGADEWDKLAKISRKKSGSVVECSPYGTGDRIVVEDAIKKLKPGSVLRVFPDDIKEKKHRKRKRVLIELDNVTVEGNGSGEPVYLDINTLGKNVILRNIWLCGSFEGEGVTIVDSRVKPFICSAKSKRTTSLVYNCIINSAAVYPNNAEVVFKNCTLVKMFQAPKTVMVAAQWKVGGGGAGGERRVGAYGGIISLGQVASSSSLHLINCIVYTNGYLLGHRWKVKPLKVIFKHNYIYCERGFVKMKNNTAGANDTYKDIKQICKVSKEGENIFEKVNFSREPKYERKPCPGIDYLTTSPVVIKKELIGAQINNNGLPQSSISKSSLQVTQKK